VSLTNRLRNLYKISITNIYTISVTKQLSDLYTISVTYKPTE